MSHRHSGRDRSRVVGCRVFSGQSVVNDDSFNDDNKMQTLCRLNTSGWHVLIDRLLRDLTYEEVSLLPQKHFHVGVMHLGALKAHVSQSTYAD